MEVKKNKKMRIEKNSGLYFVLGLCLVLGLSYVALEWKTFENDTIYLGKLDNPDFLPNEQVPFIKTPEPIKPKPIIAPPVIEIIEDTDEKDDTLFEIPESDSDLEIPTIDDIPVVDDIPNESVSFIVVEDKPIFPGCEDASDKHACFQEMMQTHIRRNFKYPESAITMNQQGKVYVQFTIQKDGTVDDVKLRGPYQILEKEAARIISKLPKMTPGKQRGTPVKVPFSVPINFVLQ
ncbi:TonB family protein [Muricauda sp. SCSIO 64092]|uniref:energy transducer TonB n=1 Tax=Allomuricauda sp. SCSIO 64092 TaxID=2908842 RepID=UPI001FF3F932|nr:energy transducer TonB [Muricauda sp. SCSIO 64092]UOY07653.1 TonB family protein [Muricauda sp. SCSIO 64092]